MWICDGPGKIGKVDVAPGKVTLVGDAGVVLTDIGFDPEGKLFGVSFDTFYSIDGTTGAATAIGDLGPIGINALVFSTTGTAYAMGNGGDDLYRMNTTVTTRPAEETRTAAAQDEKTRRCPTDRWGHSPGRDGCRDGSITPWCSVTA